MNSWNQFQQECAKRDQLSRKKEMLIFMTWIEQIDRFGITIYNPRISFRYFCTIELCDLEGFFQIHNDDVQFFIHTPK